MDSFNNEFFFDFSDSVSGQASGNNGIDTKMSDSSMNPVANAVVKKYIDESKSVMTRIFVNKSGSTGYSSTNLLAHHELILCYASASPNSPPSCYPVPLRYMGDTLLTPIRLHVADNEGYTTFAFDKNGFYVDDHSGDAPGKVLAVYGIVL